MLTKTPYFCESLIPSPYHTMGTKRIFGKHKACGLIVGTFNSRNIFFILDMTENNFIRLATPNEEDHCLSFQVSNVGFIEVKIKTLTKRYKYAKHELGMIVYTMST